MGKFLIKIGNKLVEFNKHLKGDDFVKYCAQCFDVNGFIVFLF